jgi:hypothetical protein
MFQSPRRVPVIISQEQAFLKAHVQFQILLDFVARASAEQQRLDQTERGLLSGLLEVGRSLLTAFVAGAGDGDRGETTTAADGSVQRRLPEQHTRIYRSLFGTLSITRYVYGTREGQRIACVPLDAQLGLPEGEFSYVLQDWLQRFAVKGSFAEAAQSLEELLGIKPSVRSIEDMNRTMADVAATFIDQRPTPPASEEGELVVLTADGKGVVMRRPAVEGPRQSPTPDAKAKTGKKQMACVGAFYTIDRFVRTPDQVIDELQRKQRAKDRPRPCHKHVWAEMTCVVEGETYNGRVTLFDHLAEEWARRDPAERKTAICLFDGERALWDAWELFFENTIGILDIFHVLEYLWDAAHCFHPEQSRAAADFATDRLRMMLEGKVGYVIGGLRQMQTKHGLPAAKRKKLATVIGYFENNRAHMQYDEYLAAGYPIGSGVAEGACRHLVKDRLEQTGMRWVRDGAQAMLYLRATYLNGDWDEFIDYRIRTEQKRLYATPDHAPQFTLAA